MTRLDYANMGYSAWQAWVLSLRDTAAAAGLPAPIPITFPLLAPGSLPPGESYAPLAPAALPAPAPFGLPMVVNPGETPFLGDPAQRAILQWSDPASQSYRDACAALGGTMGVQQDEFATPICNLPAALGGTNYVAPLTWGSLPIVGKIVAAAYVAGVTYATAGAGDEAAVGAIGIGGDAGAGAVAVEAAPAASVIAPTGEAIGGAVSAPVIPAATETAATGATGVEAALQSGAGKLLPAIIGTLLKKPMPAVVPRGQLPPTTLPPAANAPATATVNPLVGLGLLGLLALKFL